jgi:uncharacterized protein with PQ loop repeat
MPQLVRLLRAREAFGVSVDTAATSSIVSFSWVTYGILTGQFYFTLASGLTGLIFVLITLFALRFGRQVKEFRVAPIWLAVLLLAGVAGGKNGLGLILAISVLVANIPQVWLAYKESNLTDLSLGTWLISTMEGLIWLTYSLLQKDISITVSAFFQVMTSGLIVALKLSHQARIQRQEASMPSPISRD